MRFSTLFIVTTVCVVIAASTLVASPPWPSTFSIVAADPETGEVGVAVASRFFSVGSVVPHARAGVGAVATQSYANTTFGPRGLDLFARGATSDEVLQLLLRSDSGRERRQVGVVSATGDAATFTGSGCNAWAGGRSGPNYAVQGNILAGQEVVTAMEQAFLDSEGKPLAERLYAALKAGDDAGGDSRGKQSAALLVCRKEGGYGGFTDRAIDIRVDDHSQPMRELGRLLDIGLVNDAWNRGWTAFTEDRPEDALRWQMVAAEKAESQPEVLPEVLYDLAVIELANGDHAGARTTLERAVTLNPRLAEQAKVDDDLAALRKHEEEF
jgi:uncharacterized Ntn-hydrolase superfamily protein